MLNIKLVKPCNLDRAILLSLPNLKEVCNALTKLA